MKQNDKKDEIKEYEAVVDEEGNAVVVEEKKKPSIKEWISSHKKWIVVGAVGLIAIIAGVGIAAGKHSTDEDDDSDDYDEDDEDEDYTDDDSEEENESEESTED